MVIHILNHEGGQVLFRFRIKKRDEPYTINLDSGYNLDLEKHYAFLSLSEANSLSLDNLMEILNDAIIQLEKTDSLSPGCCNLCLQLRPLRLQYENGSIVKICESCLAQKREERVQEVEKLRLTQWPFMPTAFLAGAYTAMIWILACLTYDWFFDIYLAGVDEIYVSGFLISACLALIGFAILLPVTFGLSQTKLSFDNDAPLITSVILTAGMILGDIIYWCIYLKTINILLVFSVAFQQAYLYTAVKLGLSIGVLIVMHMFFYRSRLPNLHIDKS
ncbi:MAG: hypothetical protein KC422_06180 [Trueperaceae bacterium]|nr:hypothetical protein [Trueperaceae bacterium]